MEPMAGRTVGAYRIIEQIGVGGMATVYKAYHPALDREVAVKILPAHLAADPTFFERFRREARAVAKLEHPHILPVHDFGQEGNLSYLVMRYVPAGTLKQALAQPLDLARVVNLITQIASALDHAHEGGIVHRDVKPSNVLMDRGDWALLTDFGVARMMEGTEQLTATGVGIGTPAYMSPEQGMGKRADRRSDVYSLGVMLYEMLVGRVPFEAETPMAVVFRHINDPLPLPRSLNPNIPEAVERVVLKAMAKNPNDRFQTAGDLAKALEAASRLAPISFRQAPQAAPLPLALPHVRSRRAFRVVAILFACLAVVGLGVGAIRSGVIGGPQATPTAAPPPTEVPPPAGPSGELEIFSWWTGGGEGQGLAAMLEVFQALYPDVEVINAAVAGGAGVDMRAVLATRMQGGDPPDSLQVHAGHELIDTYVVPGQMEPLTDLFREQGWIKAMPPDLVSLLSYEGDIWSVPVNIHRVNVLWYNKAVFEANQLQPPATMDEFFTVAEALKKAKITPLALGESWTQVHLFETVLLGSLGPEAYMGLWTGATDWGSADVTKALDNFKRMLGYVNEDVAALSWDQATWLVIDGTAAMNVMGDWAEGYFEAQGWRPGEEFGWAASPGSAGSFDALSDSFALPKDAPNPDAALAWLKVCGSREGQDAFNPFMGSIAARTDGDRSLYDVYLQSAMDDLSKDMFVPSLTHGAAAAPSWQQDIIDAVGLFIANRDVATFQSALVTACRDAGVRQ